MPTEELFLSTQAQEASSTARSLLDAVGLADEYDAALAQGAEYIGGLKDAANGAAAQVSGVYDLARQVATSAADIPGNVLDAVQAELEAAKAAALAAGSALVKDTARSAGVGLAIGGIFAAALVGLGIWFFRRQDPEKVARVVGAGLGAAAGNPRALLP